MGLLMCNVMLAAFNDSLSPIMILIGAFVVALYMFGWYRDCKMGTFVGIFVGQMIMLSFLAHLDIVALPNPWRLLSLLYDVLSGGVFVLGVKALLDWIKQDHIDDNKGSRLKFKQASVLGVAMAVAIFAVVNKIATNPIDPYMTALVNNLFGRVAGMVSLLSLGLYVILKFWMIWFLIAVFQWGRFNQRLRLMLAAAFCLAAGIGMFFVK